MTIEEATELLQKYAPKKDDEDYMLSGGDADWVYENDRITTICDYAMRGRAIQKISCPNVTKIGGAALGCDAADYSLISATFDNCETVGWSVFENEALHAPVGYDSSQLYSDSPVVGSIEKEYGLSDRLKAVDPSLHFEHDFSVTGWYTSEELDQRWGRWVVLSDDQGRYAMELYSYIHSGLITYGKYYNVELHDDGYVSQTTCTELQKQFDTEFDQYYQDGRGNDADFCA